MIARMKKHSITYQIYGALIFLLTAIVFYHYFRYEQSEKDLNQNHIEIQIRP
jgi:hypothetical protein